ncbi:MAG: TRAP transporter large permease [Pseudomonadota bacterium]|nr:TRAP transporter large permease [Pseudomonadota bacterium]
MSGLLEGAIGIAVLLGLTGLGVHVGVSIIAVGVTGLLLVGGPGFMQAMVSQLPFETTNKYNFVVIPMFVLMGAFASTSGIVRDLYDAAYKWTAGIRGGLYIATSAASAGFAAVSGSTVVNAAIFTRIALPEMIRFGYDRGLGAGCIAAAGTFAALIPPSLSFVIYGVLTGESIGALLIAGVIPGIMTAACYIAIIPVLVRLRPQWAPENTQRFSFNEKLASLGGLWPMILLMGLVLGGIYGGFMPPSAAGAVGAVGALLIGLAKRSLNLGSINDSLRQAAVTGASLFVILIGGFIFSRFLVLCGFIGELNVFLTTSGISSMEFVYILVAAYFVLGMFIDPISMLAMTIPIVAPLVNSYGLDPIWFGVIVVKMIEIAVITPPVGVNLFAVVAASEGKVTTAQVFRGVLPFVVLEIFILLVLINVPIISTWLPGTMAR